MKNIAIVLEYLYPNAKPNVDYFLQDDGNGAYIKQWNLLDEKPSDDFLLSKEEEAVFSVLKKRRKQEILSELEKSDLKIIRSIVEGDNIRISKHNEKQLKLRAELQSL